MSVLLEMFFALLSKKAGDIRKHIHSRRENDSGTLFGSLDQQLFCGWKLQILEWENSFGRLEISVLICFSNVELDGFVLRWKIPFDCQDFGYGIDVRDGNPT